jgi:large subunit ribosomal protein L18
MSQEQKQDQRRRRRKRHVRKRVAGTPERPRLTVFRSHKNIYAQIIDDTAGRTLVSASTREKPMRQKVTGSAANKGAAALVGAALAAKAVEAGIKKVVFDRNGYAYHGRVQQLADAARKGGLEF